MTDEPDEKMRVERPETYAVGWPAIKETVIYGAEEMGVRRGVKTLLKLNQVEGFDCPSCAWPDPHPKERKRAEFCENGAKATSWEATTDRVTREFFANNAVSDLLQVDAHTLEHHGRLTEPMYLAPGADHYTPISWDGALTLIAERLKALDSPHEAAFYTSGRSSNEAAFVFQLLARRFGTNNLPDCSNMCHESSGTALTEVIGIGKGVVDLDDINDYAELIIVAGQNPGTNHPRMLTALEKAKKRHARIVSINPLPEAGLIRFKNPHTSKGLIGGGTKLSDRHMAVRVNGDLAMFAGLNKILLEREEAAPGTIFDHHFINTYCDGFEEACDAWRSLDWSTIESQSGITREEIEVLADDAVWAKSVIVTWAMGLTQHRNAVATIREIVNFLLLRGNIGRPGAGPAPIRGHSNVQGDRTMGIWEKMPDSFLDKLRDEFGFEPPREHGFDTVDTVRALRDGTIRVFFALGGNFVAATSDTAVAESSMSNCDLTVHVSTKLNRSHLCHGKEALILPCLGRSDRDVQASGEQFVTVEDSMAMVHASHGRLDPGSVQLRSEVAIVTGLGKALFGEDIGWSEMADDYRVIRRHIEHVVPGFQSFEERVAVPGGFVLPRGPHDSRTFNTATGKARFTVNPPDAIEAPAGHLLLQTLRSHDQFNTTVYGLDDRYRGIFGGRRVVLLNRADIAESGLRDGDDVDLISVWTDGERRAKHFRVVEYDTPKGSAAAYYPETNVLVPLDATAIGSNTPTSKSIVIRVEPSQVDPRSGGAVSQSASM
jgi:molybdopterin-dependent oxidoreductase alpha subunit